MITFYNIFSLECYKKRVKRVSPINGLEDNVILLEFWKQKEVRQYAPLFVSRIFYSVRIRVPYR